MANIKITSLTEGYGGKKRRREKYPSKRDDGFLTATDFQGRAGHPLQIPREVLAERERRYFLEAASITAALMGDPLPTTSALDRRGS